MTSTINTAHLKLDIPLFTFQTILDPQHPHTNIVFANFATTPALAQAAYPHRHDFYEILYLTGGEGMPLAERRYRAKAVAKAVAK